MQKLIRSQRKSYWNFVNTASKKAVIAFAAVIICFGCSLSIESVRVSAYDFIENVITKTKSIFQEAYEKGIPLSEVDTEGNFKYTEFEGDERDTQTDETASTITGETFKDPKTNIYNKMLNTIDFFNTVELSVDIYMAGSKNLTVDYYTDIDASKAYEATYEKGTLIRETFCNPDNYFLTDVNHKEKYIDPNYFLVYKREDSPYIPLEERIKIDPETKDGVPCYLYRRNITNCTMASYCLFPEGMTYSYLADFDLWEIADDNVEFLGRKCIKITGSSKPYSGRKHNNDSFMMLVDSNTGILLNFEGYKNGEKTSYITATKCIVDENIVIKEFNSNDYPSYTEYSRYYIKRD